MSDFNQGDRVEADCTGTMPELVAGAVMQATVQGPGNQPGTYRVQTDTPVNGNDLFDLTPDRLRRLPSH
jgi:hypothetical protein